MDLKVFDKPKMSIYESNTNIEFSAHEEHSTAKKPLEFNKPFAGEKPHAYACSYCTKTFATKSKLKEHERTHTGERPYACSYCSKQFARTSDLVIHVRSHTGEKPFACSYCSTSFAIKSTLKQHERTHTGEKPYSCSYCSKTFSQASSLKAHEQTHTGERPFVCNVCASRFTQKSALVSHKRSHTGEKPFTCNYCDSRFRQHSTLARHKRLSCKEISNRLQLDDRSTLPISYQTHSPILEQSSEQKPSRCSVAAETLLSYDEELKVSSGIESSTVVEVMSVEASDFFLVDSKPFDC